MLGESPCISGKYETHFYHTFDVLRFTKKINMLFLELPRPINHNYQCSESYFKKGFRSHSFC